MVPEAGRELLSAQTTEGKADTLVKPMTKSKDVDRKDKPVNFFTKNTRTLLNSQNKGRRPKTIYQMPIKHNLSFGWKPQIEDLNASVQMSYLIV